MEIYLLRHGTTEWNARHQIQGGSDIPLDQLGEKMARETGVELIRLGIFFDRVFSSPLSRALATARLACPYQEPEADEHLRELNFGPFEGRTVKEMTSDPTCAFRYFKVNPARYDFEVRLLQKQPGEKVPESLTELCRRASAFIEEKIDPLVRDSSARRILISGHGAMNKALLMAFQKKTDLRSFWGKGLQDNCGITLIKASAGKDGSVIYQSDETSLTYYPEALKAKISSLL